MNSGYEEGRFLPARVTLEAQQLCLPATTSSPVDPGPAWASDIRIAGS